VEAKRRKGREAAAKIRALIDTGVKIAKAVTPGIKRKMDWKIGKWSLGQIGRELTPVNVSGYVTFNAGVKMGEGPGTVRLASDNEGGRQLQVDLKSAEYDTPLGPASHTVMAGVVPPSEGELPSAAFRSENRVGSSGNYVQGAVNPLESVARVGGAIDLDGPSSVDGTLRYGVEFQVDNVKAVRDYVVGAAVRTVVAGVISGCYYGGPYVVAAAPFVIDWLGRFIPKNPIPGLQPG
jgi:hypothetical protein